jgi:hypothetical protein
MAYNCQLFDRDVGPTRPRLGVQVLCGESSKKKQCTPASFLDGEKHGILSL